MNKVIIASENPIKVNVAKRAFSSVWPDGKFEFIAIKSESGVPDQPIDEETEKGAVNRLEFIKKEIPTADFWISQEGGLYQDGKKLYSRAWIVACDKGGYQSISSTASFYLPEKIANDINDGMELGDAIDKFIATKNSKQDIGAIGHLTDGLINRENYYLQSAIIALCEIKNQSWFRS